MVTRPLAMIAFSETRSGNLRRFCVRLLDLVLCLPIALVFLPIWGLQALLAFTWGKPWLEKRMVLGQNAERFSLYEVSAHQGVAAFLFNRAILRQSPRLWAVLRGQMSLVGPGLLDIAQVAALNSEQQARFVVPPGLVHSYFLRSSVNIAEGDEADLALEDARPQGLLHRFAMMLRGMMALLLQGSKRIPGKERLELFGLSLINETREEAVTRLLDLANRSDGGCAQVAFVNPDCVNIAMANPAYRNLLEGVELIFPDGIGIKLAARYVGDALIANLNGTDLFPALCERLEHSGLGIYLLGARPGVVDDMVMQLKIRWPELLISGYHHGYINNADENAKVIADIGASGASLLFVAMGVPMQEYWIARHQKELGVKLALGVGGLFDFYSGRMPRAPLWMREIGMEWLFRLMREPRRLWRRYVLGNFVFLWHLLRYHRGRK